MHTIKNAVAYLYVAGFLLLQIIFNNVVGSASVKPHLLIVVTVFYALFTDKHFGLRIGVLSGMLLDVFSVRLFGINTVIFGLTGYIVGKYNIQFYRESIITHFTITFIASLFILSLYFFVINVHAHNLASRRGLEMLVNAPVLLSAFLTALVAVPIFAFLCRLSKMGEW